MHRKKSPPPRESFNRGGGGGRGNKGRRASKKRDSSSSSSSSLCLEGLVTACCLRSIQPRGAWIHCIHIIESSFLLLPANFKRNDFLLIGKEERERDRDYVSRSWVRFFVKVQGIKLACLEVSRTLRAGGGGRGGKRGTVRREWVGGAAAVGLGKRWRAVFQRNNKETAVCLLYYIALREPA